MLEQTSSYEYIGIDLNIDLNFDQQWRIIQTSIRGLPYLVKKLKHICFNKSFIKNVYISLGLSNFTYNVPILASYRQKQK